jgi:peptidoglycan/xylan/chitin deacetylase (PgdA/CDA1 family)
MIQNALVFSSLKIVDGTIAALARKIRGPITRVATGDTVAALTFDDGPHPEFTPRLLEILDRYHARATFFMIGENARRHPDLVRRVAQAGHVIGNHSWNHSVFPSLTRRERRAQIKACTSAIAPYGQRLFRPPQGYHNLASHLDALWLGYKVVNWNVAVDDWCSLDADWMAGRLMSQISPGSVILLHDGLCDPVGDQYLDRGPMLKAVNILLSNLGHHFSFVTIPELLQHGRPQRADFFWKPDATLE